MPSLLEVKNLSKFFPVTSGLWKRSSQMVRAVDRVNFNVMPGETVGLVGESGCGKTTLGRSVLRLIEPDEGSVIFDGINLTKLSTRQLRKIRPRMQMVFQDPYSSLNPRMVVLDLIGEGMAEHGLVKTRAEKEERVVSLLEQVGLSSEFLYRYPHEFSGGQRQRIAIARAISLNPSLIVCDEAVSALDVSIQAQIINLLEELRARLNIAYLFISHDLAVVKHISNRIAVMYLGQIVEFGLTPELFTNPVHPYTQALLSAILLPDPERKTKRIILKGEVDLLQSSQSGCPFASRCPMAFDTCRSEDPPVKRISETHWVKCFR